MLLKTFKRHALVAVMLLLLMSNTCYCNKSEQKEVIQIPLDLSSQRPVIKLKINGKGPYNFIFDTGSSANIIDEGLANELKLEVIGQDPMGTPGSSTTMVSKRVEASGISFVNTDLLIEKYLNTMPLKQMLPVDGIISPSIFSDYLVTIDYQGSKLILTKGALNPDDESVISFSQEPRIINTKVDIDGSLLEAHIDSGNPGFFAIPYDLKDKLSFKEDPTEDGIIRTPGAEFKKWKAQLDGNITIGNIVFNDPTIQLVEGFPVVNMGFGFLSEVIVTIDGKNGLIKFEKSSVQTPQAKTPLASEYVGWYGGKVRQVLEEDGQLFIRRADGPKLKLDKIHDDYFKMTFPMPVANELPNVRFERATDETISGLTYVFGDGREDFVKKD